MKKIPRDEKVKLTSGQGNWHFFDSPYVEGRSIHVADGPHGIRVYRKPVEGGNFSNHTHVQPATLFPSASAMASTWNRFLIEQVGRAIGRECRHHGVDVVLGPGLNLKRSPLGGRNFEYYSEDPYLTGEIGTSFVRGVQAEQVGACVKHFALNEQETMRRFVDVVIDERTMHEMYLYPFYQVIQRANPWMVMSSYNRVNGTYASESSALLHTVLRTQWGYKGAVVSDWGAVQDKVKSIKHGMNIDMPGPSAFEGVVNEALDNGGLSEAQLDASLAPVFALHEKVKAITRLKTIDMDAHHQLAQDVAREAIVLLENDGILPLKNPDYTVAIVGHFAKAPRVNGGGSAMTRPHTQEIPFDAFSTVLNHLSYADGYRDNTSSQAQIDEALKVARDSDVVLFFTGTTDEIETEGKDRDHMALPTHHLKVFDAIRHVNDNIVVILSNGSALDLRTIKPYARAIVETWFLGGAAAQAIVDVVMGRISPSGRLQETFPLQLEHTPHYGTFPQEVSVDYRHDLIMNGYRYYDTHQHEVLYPFGYGLSYGDIHYQKVSWTTDETNPKSTVTIDVELENRSDIDAHETMQVYLSTNIETIIKPRHELKAFKKVMVPANAIRSVRIDVPLEAFQTYDVRRHGFVVYNGTYHLKLGRHSRDIQDALRVDITQQIPYTPQMTLDYPVNFLARYYPTWFTHIEKHFRPLRWHEKEEPIWRILDRYQRHHNVSERTIETIKKQMKEDFDA